MDGASFTLGRSSVVASEMPSRHAQSEQPRSSESLSLSLSLFVLLLLLQFFY